MDGLYFTFVGGFWLFGSATNYSPKLLHVTSLKFRVMLVSNNRQRERKILFGWRKGSDVNDTESLTIDHNCRKDQTTSLIHTIYICSFFFLPTIRHLESIVFFCTVLLRTLGTDPSKFNLTWFVRAVLTVFTGGLTPEEKNRDKGNLFSTKCVGKKQQRKYHHHHHGS